MTIALPKLSIEWFLGDVFTGNPGLDLTKVEYGSPENRS